MALSPLRAAAHPRTLVPHIRGAFGRAYRYDMKVYGQRANTLSAKAIVTRPICDKNITMLQKSTMP
jgi:hypothetical protein